MTDLEISGRMHFDPPPATRKNEKQAAWKNVAVLLFPGDDHLYYAWFVKRRYGLSLNRPLRRFHLTFVNDRASDMRAGAWDLARKNLEGVEAGVRLSPDLRTNGEHWWLRVTDSGALAEVRVGLGLAPSPFWSFHATVGYAAGRELESSQRIHRLITKGLIC